MRADVSPVDYEFADWDWRCRPMRVDGSVESSSPAARAVLAAERLLVLFPGYSAPSGSEQFADATMVGNAFARLLAMMRRPATRDHVRLYRDYYANPRGPGYMAERLRALVGSGEGRRRTLVLDAKLDCKDARAGWDGDICRSVESLARSPGDLAELLRTHDAVLMLHSDALGLGLGALERRLVGALPAGVFVLNGRRRLYRSMRACNAACAAAASLPKRVSSKPPWRAWYRSLPGCLPVSIGS